jgi:hypothetical protein
VVLSMLAGKGQARGAPHNASEGRLSVREGSHHGQPELGIGAAPRKPAGTARAWGLLPTIVIYTKATEGPRTRPWRSSTRPAKPLRRVILQGCLSPKVPTSPWWPSNHFSDRLHLTDIHPIFKGQCPLGSFHVAVGSCSPNKRPPLVLPSV